MTAWLRTAWAWCTDRRYSARRRREVLDDERAAEELRAAREGTSPRPFGGG